MALFEKLGIFGWDHLEDTLIASIVARSNVMFCGLHGNGKTYAWNRIAKALQLEAEDRGEEYVKRMIDVPNTKHDSFIGYPYPDQEARQAARDRGEMYKMEMILSPQSLYYAKAILLDEATRVPPAVQSKFYNLLTGDEVDGHRIPFEFIWGTTNPTYYAGVERVDYAYADRWTLIVNPPTSGELGTDLIHEMMRSAYKLQWEPSIDLAAAQTLRHTIDDARTAFDKVGASIEYDLNEYLAMMASILGWMNEDDPRHREKKVTMNLRRYRKVIRHIVALRAVREVSGGRYVPLEEDVYTTLRQSEVHSLLKIDPWTTDGEWEEAHDQCKALLAGQNGTLAARVAAARDSVDILKIIFDDTVSMSKNERGLALEDFMERMRVNEPITAHAVSWALLYHTTRNKMSLIPQNKLMSVVGTCEEMARRASEFKDMLHPEILKKATNAHEFIRAIGTLNSQESGVSKLMRIVLPMSWPNTFTQKPTSASLVGAESIVENATLQVVEAHVTCKKVLAALS